MLQVRNLPDDVHARLKERAKASRKSLSDYVAGELTELVRYRSNAEIFAAARSRAAQHGIQSVTAADLVHEARRERGEQRRDPLGD